MKVLFVRHGESVDDIENRYGGWADFPLTTKGEELIKSRVEAIKSLNEPFEVVFTSPLLRAKKSAEILSDGLNLSVETMEYFKERNTYGVLSGMEKNQAREKYPDQVDLLDQGEYVDGSERRDDIVSRVRKALQMLERSGHQMVIVVTHGVLLKSLAEDIMGRKLIKKDDGGFLLVDLDGGALRVISTNGIEIS